MSKLYRQWHDYIISKYSSNRRIPAQYLFSYSVKSEMYRPVSFSRSAKRSASIGGGCARKAPRSIYRRGRNHEKTETMKFQLSLPDWFARGEEERERGEEGEEEWAREFGTDTSEISPDASEGPAEKW